MAQQETFTLVVLGASLLLLVLERGPMGVVALLGATALVVGGVLRPDELLAELAHPAVVVVGAMFVVSAAIGRTGALSFLGDGLSEIAERRGSPYLVVVVMLATGLVSAFTNNTTVVLVGIPLLLAVCERARIPPSRLLIPLSFASIFGGCLTLIGTSTNIVVAELAPAGHRPAMWDFAPMGAVFFLLGVLYMATIGLRLLPDRVALSMTLSRDVPTEYVTEAEVLEGSPLVGRRLGEVADRYGVHVLQLVRHGIIEVPSDDAVLEPGDVLLVKAKPTRLADFTGTGAALRSAERGAPVPTREVGVTLAEVIVPPGSRWIDRRVREIGFRSRYGVDVVALQRHGHHVRRRVGDMRVQPGDMLLVQGAVENLRNLRASDNLILIESVEPRLPSRGKARTALLVLLGFVALVTFSDLGLPVSALLAATAMVLTRCLTFQQAQQALDWNVLLALAGFLAMGRSLEVTGLADRAAQAGVTALDGLPPGVVVAVLYAVTAFASDLLSNAAVAALMVPIVVKAGRLLEMAPEPLIMTVAFAASAAFLTPVGYQTNLLVYGPGGYRFSDFVRVGLPLRLLFVVAAGLFLPLFHPP